MKRENIEKVLEGYAFDTETWVTESGVPPMVCCAFYKNGAGDVFGGDREGKLKALEWYLKLLRSGQTLIALNGPFDHIVMAKAARDLLGIDIIAEIFQAYLNEQCFDISLAEQLHALACGHLGKDPISFRETYYSLKDVTEMVTGREDAKANDAWRMRYRELDGLPISVWPVEARQYPMDDVRNTWDVAQIQVKRNKNLHDLQNQQYTDWCLTLGAYYGLTVDPVEIDKLWANTEKLRAEQRGTLLSQGFVREDPDGSFKTDEPYTKRRVAQAFGVSGQCKACGPWGDLYAAWVARQIQREELSVANGRRAAVTTRLPKFKGGKVPGQEKCKGHPTQTVNEKTGRPKKGWSGCYENDLCACKGTGKTLKTRTCSCKGKDANCNICHGDGKEIGGWKGCDDCSTTGLDLATAPFPTTATGGISKGRDALNESGDEELIAFAHYDETAKVLSTYIPWLREGIDPDTGQTRPLKLRPRVLKETGRAGYGGAVHQAPRDLGVRECVVSRPGRVLIASDWTGAELITHAQSCLWIVGESKMAEALLSGIKVHDQLGARIGNVSYEHMVANRETDKQLGAYRQSAKPANFGFPGLMGAPALVIQQRVQGPDTTGPDGRLYKGLRFCLLAGGEQTCGHTKVTEWNRKPITPMCKRCVEVAEDIRKVWLGTWTENVAYFKYVKLINQSGSMVQHVTKRIRTGMFATAVANGYFQGLAGDAMKLAIQRMSYEMYVDRSSVLFGNAWLILPIHDEAFAEAREECYAACAQRISEIMVKALQDFCPDLAPAVKAEAVAMRRWDKNAKALYDANGRLLVFEGAA